MYKHTCAHTHSFAQTHVNMHTPMNVHHTHTCKKTEKYVYTGELNNMSHNCEFCKHFLQHIQYILFKKKKAKVI